MCYHGALVVSSLKTHTSSVQLIRTINHFLLLVTQVMYDVLMINNFIGTKTYWKKNIFNDDMKL